MTERMTKTYILGVETSEENIVEQRKEENQNLLSGVTYQVC